MFHALADATRRDILEVALTEELSVSALARRYPISITAVQKHVDVLARAGMVRKRRQGREQLVGGDVGAIREAARLLDRLESIWRSRLDRFTAVLDDDVLAPPPSSPNNTNTNTASNCMSTRSQPR
jgi:DNA-binding transcriptional ArsR family regulator